MAAHACCARKSTASGSLCEAAANMLPSTSTLTNTVFCVCAHVPSESHGAHSSFSSLRSPSSPGSQKQSPRRWAPTSEDDFIGQRAGSTPSAQKKPLGQSTHTRVASSIYSPASQVSHWLLELRRYPLLHVQSLCDVLCGGEILLSPQLSSTSCPGQYESAGHTAHDSVPSLMNPATHLHASGDVAPCGAAWFAPHGRHTPSDSFAPGEGARIKVLASHPRQLSSLSLPVPGK